MFVLIYKLRPINAVFRLEFVHITSDNTNESDH